MIDYRLRRVEAADSPALYELNCCTMRSYVEQVFGCWDEDVQRDFHQQWMNRQRAQIIEVDGRVAGVVNVEWRATEVYLARIQVTPELQNRGLGSAVISDLIRQATGRGCAVVLEVFDINPARRLYERLGFHAVGISGRKIRMRRPHSP